MVPLLGRNTPEPGEYKPTMIYIGVIGASVCEGETATNAYLTGREIASSGAVLICGGMGGVMEEACRGAKEAGGISIGILPGNSRQWENPYLTYSIVAGIGEARNIMVAKSSDALVAVGGCYGTLSEIAFALKCEKPVAGLGTWKLQDGDGNIPPVKYFDKPADAVQWAVSAAEDKITL